MSKPTSRGAKAPKPETTRTNLSLGAEQYRRLFMHALMSNRSAGEIVTALIEEHLKTWALPAKLSDRSHGSHRLPVEDQTRDSAPPEPIRDAA